MDHLALRRARKLLAGGWVGPAMEPWCRASDGTVCMEDFEGLSLFSVQGAVMAAGAWPDGWYALERVMAPATAAASELCSKLLLTEPIDVEGFRQFQRLCREAEGEPDFQRWLQEPTRTLEDVLRVFNTAVLRSEREKRT